MTLEHGYIASIEAHQERARWLIEQARHEPSKRFALLLLDDAESALANADNVRERANQYVH